MSLFGGFNIGGAINSATSNFSSVSGVIGSITGGTQKYRWRLPRCRQCSTGSVCWS